MKKTFIRIILFFILSSLFANYGKHMDSGHDKIESHSSWMTQLSDDGISLAEKMLLADSLVEASFNEDGSFTIKKVAYPKEDPEGGVDFPAFFNEIHVAPDGYVLYGVFSFGSQDVSHKDTLNITNVFLDSDLISPID